MLMFSTKTSTDRRALSEDSPVWTVVWSTFQEQVKDEIVS